MAMMKLKLNPDDLRVESFTPLSAESGYGTVQAYGVDPVQSGPKRTMCLCPATSLCIPTVDAQTCVVTACNDFTCTCPPATGPTCDQDSCIPTFCAYTCDLFCA